MSKQPKQERAERTRRSIVLGAATVFDRVGYERASLASICEAAGVTKGAFAFHFASKAELAHAVQQLACDESRRKLVALRRPEASALQELVDMTGLLTELLHTDPVTRAGARLAREFETLRDPSVDCHLCWLELFWHTYQRAEADGSALPGTCARTVAALVWMATIGVDALARSQPAFTDPDGAAPVKNSPQEWLTRIWRVVLPQVASAEERTRVRLP
ncbi:ScbR family autoregulator-binding transcription factor [Kitasatospora sp. NPDC056783]|uniref:ScbR family autoregulator-binding transcription factor n=1 Tax=Kitasatospora sp. NPDC056783 TaxID=3345943 RepID=UPI0036C192DC